MIIRQVDESDPGTLQYEDLLSYLSQVVLSQTDDEIETKHSAYRKSKQDLQYAKGSLDSNRREMLEASKELSKLRVIDEILSIIESLNENGMLYGPRKSKFLALLNDLRTKSFPQLKSLAEKLRIQMPQGISKSTVS